METTKKTYIADIERGIYDVKDEMKHKFTTGKGLDENVVKRISEKKNEPEWMLEKRLHALKIFFEKPMPTWSTDLSDLDINEIVHYLETESENMNSSWEDVPEYIKKLLIDWVYLRQKKNLLQELEPNMIQM